MVEEKFSSIINNIASADHCQAGATIALSGALAAALARATAVVTELAETDEATAQASQVLKDEMSTAAARFQALADQDATAIGEFVKLRENGQPLQGYQVLCEGPREMADLAWQAATAMQTYRPFVGPRPHDDLEFAITLMAGTARAALQLLDSNLRIWPLPELLAQFDPAVHQLHSRIGLLNPRPCIR